MNESPSEVRNDLQLRLEEVRRGMFRRRCLRAFIMFVPGSMATTLLCLGWFHVRGENSVDWMIGVAAFLLIHVVMAAALTIHARRQAPTSEQIALYVDEHHPELENLILSASESIGAGPEPTSAWMIERIRSDPRLAPERLSLGPLLPRGQRLKFLTAAGLLFIFWMSAIFALRSIWLPPFAVGVFPGREVRSQLVVEPGNARVRRGQDQVIVAKVSQAGSMATLRWRTEGGEWRVSEMTPGKTPQIHYHELTGIESPIEYKVSWQGVSSPEYRLNVWEAPEIASIDLTYRYPEYLALPPRHVPGGGNIAGVEGTEVELNLSVNKPLSRAAVVLESGKEIELARSGELAWTGALRLETDDSYHVELRDGDGEMNPMSRKYSIVVKPDHPPVIRVKFPRGDSDATSLDEIPFAFEVEDDFGLADYGLQYQVSGRERVRLSLKDSQDTVEATGAFSLALEEMALKPGDLMTWSAWAEDRRPGRAEFEGFGDLYFLQVRPFAQRFREATSQAGQQMGGGGAGLAEAQKQVLLATWNLRSKLSVLPEADYDAGRATVLEAELSILQQVEGMVHQASSEEAEAVLRQLSAELAKAVQALEVARGGKAAGKLTEAEAHERTAYEMLLEDPDIEMEVARVSSMSNEMRRSNPVGLDELEMDRNRNFYEEESRTRPESPAGEAALDRLRELAARQALISDEIAKLISELNQANSKQEREEIRRRLERLKEEIRQNLEQIDELERELQSGSMSPDELRKASERLDEARRQSTSSLESLSSENMENSGDPAPLQQARTSSRRALDALNSLEGELTDQSSLTVEEQLDLFIRGFREFTTTEASLLDRLEGMQGESLGPGLRMPENADEERTQMLQLSHHLGEEFVAMMESAGAVADEAMQSQPLFARKFGDWLRETSGSGIAEDMDATHEALDYGLWDAAERTERDAHRKLVDAASALEELRDLLVKDESDSVEIALEKLDRLRELAGLPPRKSEENGAEAGRDQTDLSASAGEGWESSAANEAAPTAGDQADDGTEAESENTQRATGQEPVDGQGRDEFRIAWGGNQENRSASGEGDEETGRGQAGGEDEIAGMTGEGRIPKEGASAVTESGESRDGRAPTDGEAEAGSEAQGAGPSNREGIESDSPGQQAGSGASGISDDPDAMAEEGSFGMDESAGEASVGAQGSGAGSMGPSDDENVSPGEEGSRSADPNTWRPSQRGDILSNQGGESALRQLTDWPVDPRRLFESAYREWMEEIRSAQTVLGGGDAASVQLDAIALQMERLRREFRRGGHPPRFELFLETVALPLEAVSADLALRLQRAHQDSAMLMPEADEVPAQYQELVADYFEALAGVESARE